MPLDFKNPGKPRSRNKKLNQMSRAMWVSSRKTAFFIAGRFPRRVRDVVLNLGHSVPWAGHLGKHKTIAHTLGCICTGQACVQMWPNINNPLQSLYQLLAPHLNGWERTLSDLLRKANQATVICWSYNGCLLCLQIKFQVSWSLSSEVYKSKICGFLSGAVFFKVGIPSWDPDKLWN